MCQFAIFTESREIMFPNVLEMGIITFICENIWNQWRSKLRMNDAVVFEIMALLNAFVVSYFSLSCFRLEF